MSGKACLAVFVAMGIGCARSERSAPTEAETLGRMQSPVPTEQPTVSVGNKADAPMLPERPTISVGQLFDDAVAALRATGAEEFTASVGTFRPEPWQDRWFMLRGKTCLCVLIRLDGSKGAFVERLTIGEEGRGYGGKEVWPTQNRRTLDRLELP